MARRFDDIPPKKGGVKPTFYRAKQLLAIVPKSGKKSEDDESAESEDELKNIISVQKSQVVDDDNETYCSSPAPSLPSSLENFDLLVDDDETNTVTESATEFPSVSSPQVHVSAVPSPNSIPASPLASSNSINGSAPSSVIPPSPLVARVRLGRRPRLVISRPAPIRQKPLKFRWKKKAFDYCAEIPENNFPEAETVKSPYEYFTKFLTDDIIHFITEQTNLYVTQKNGKPSNVSKKDIRDFIAINLLMGIVKLPAYTDYWSRELRYAPIADIMPLKKFEMLRRHIHFNNNLLDDGDRYFKIRPIIEKVRANFLKIPHETKFSIDEMMVPYKGKKAGNRRQYVKNKPKKWGFKIFSRAGVSGIIYDFIVYGGEDTFRYNPLTPQECSLGLGAKTVIALCKSIPNPACSVVYFDNFFTSLELIKYLREEMGIFSLGTINANRLRGAEKILTSDKILKKQRRGSHSQVVCNDNKVCLVKWLDNKCVTTASSYVEANPLSTIKRYDKVSKRKIPVSCPNIIKHYNAHMGGVDLADMLVALCRTELKGHRWYLPIFSQILDICINNSWILYRRESKNIKTMPLKMFRCKVAQSLLMHDVGNTVNTADVMGPTPSKKIKAPMAPRPSTDVRYDQVGHFPMFGSKGRCKLCIKGQTTVVCSKCSLRLCHKPERNCFVSFHTDK